MNVASANTVGYGPTAFMATKASSSGSLGVGSRGVSEPGSDEAATPLRGRYPVVALSFDQDASHLVMLFRDPTTGDAVAQIPSKVVVKQYEAAQAEKKRDERRELELVVGGDLKQNAAKQGDAAAGDKTAATATTTTGEPQSIGASFAAAATATVAAKSGGGETGGYASDGASTGGYTSGGYSSGGASTGGGTTVSAAPTSTPVAGGSSGFSGRASLSLVV